MFLMNESPGFSFIPKKLEKTRNGNLRFEACLQTVGTVNRNRRLYTKGLLDEGIQSVRSRIDDGSFLGELDHPVSTDPVRQFTVLYQCVSHRIRDAGWDGDRLMGVVETVSTSKGRDLRGLITDDIPVGFSFRGMGDLKSIKEAGQEYQQVVGPLQVISWDSVSYPSHEGAYITKVMEGSQPKSAEVYDPLEITEEVRKSLYESVGVILHEKNGIKETDGVICTKEGICYIPGDFDQLIQKRIIKLVDKFKVEE